MRIQSGFSAFELLIAAPITVISIAAGAPLLQESMQKQRLERAAETLHAELRRARTRTVMEGAPTMVQFSSSGDHWHYAVDRGHSVSSREYPGVRMAVIAESDRLGFEPLRGMALSTGQVRLRSASGEIRVSVQPLGRIDRCSPAGEFKVKGYEDCPGAETTIHIASSL